MPTLAEFILRISLYRDTESDSVATLFHFETVRQFRSFRYEIEIEDRIDEKAKRISFGIKGIQISSTTMSGTGFAESEKVYRGLEGEYHVFVKGANQSASFMLQITPDDINITDEQNESFLQVELIKTIGMTEE